MDERIGHQVEFGKILYLSDEMKTLPVGCIVYHRAPDNMQVVVVVPETTTPIQLIGSEFTFMRTRSINSEVDF